VNHEEKTALLPFECDGYQRSDALEKRRKLMEARAAYCGPSDASKIVQLANRKR